MRSSCCSLCFFLSYSTPRGRPTLQLSSDKTQPSIFNRDTRWRVSGQIKTSATLKKQDLPWQTLLTWNGLMGGFLWKESSQLKERTIKNGENVVRYCTFPLRWRLGRDVLLNSGDIGSVGFSLSVIKRRMSCIKATGSLQNGHPTALFTTLYLQSLKVLIYPEPWV